MCYLGEAEKVLSIRESKTAPVYEIKLANGEEVTILKEALTFHSHGEDRGIIDFYKNGLYANSWGMIDDFLQKNGIYIPREKTPCATCTSIKKCAFHCTKDKTAEVVELAVA